MNKNDTKYKSNEQSNYIVDLTPNEKKEIFFNKDNIDYSKLMITKEGIYSSSKNTGSKFLVNLLKKYFKRTNITITDCTSNIGSDSIALGLNFSNVNAIELNSINYQVLENNINIYKLDNVKTYHGDSTIILNQLNQDVIYVDAPWGGPDYKKHTNLSLYLGTQELSDLYNNFKSKTKLFLFKVPINYDFNNLIRKTLVDKYYIHSYRSKNKIKFYLIFIPT